jgi:hypothetical protein
MHDRIIVDGRWVGRVIQKNSCCAAVRVKFLLLPTIGLKLASVAQALYAIGPVRLTKSTTFDTLNSSPIGIKSDRPDNELLSFSTCDSNPACCRTS